MRCDLHIHSTFSDGTASVDEILTDAEVMEMEIIAITDHYAALSKENRMDEYINQTNKLKGKYPFKILTGTEVCMSNKNGEVPITIEDRKRLDIVLVELMGDLVFNPESQEWQEERRSKSKLLDTVFECYINVCKNPLVDVIAHPFNLGRMALSFPFTPADIPESLLKELRETLIKYKKGFEIGSQMYYWYPGISPHQICKEYAKIINLLYEGGVKFSVGSDTHGGNSAGNIYWAISVIKTAGLPDNWKIWLIDICNKKDGSNA